MIKENKGTINVSLFNNSNYKEKSLTAEIEKRYFITFSYVLFMNYKIKYYYFYTIFYVIFIKRIIKHILL